MSFSQNIIFNNVKSATCFGYK